MRRDYLRLLLAWAPAVAAGALLWWLTLLYAGSIGVPTDFATVTPAQALPLLGVALPLAGLSTVVEFALWPRVAGIASGRPWARWGAGLRLGALLTVIYFAGLALLLVPFVVFLHWFAFAPAALADGRGVTAALEASRAFAKRRRTLGFTALLLVAMVAASLAGYALGSALTEALAGLGAPVALADALGSALGAWPFAPLVPLLPASYWAIAAAAPEERAPAPAAPRARSTTKCPRCGELVPYDASSEARTVTCPACGATGRVA